MTQAGAAAQAQADLSSLASTFGEGRSLIEPYLMALVLMVSTPRSSLSWRYLGTIAACVLPALAVVARRRILYM